MLGTIGRETRTLRVRASEFASATTRAQADDEVLIQSREQLTDGASIRIEISFGPLADEVVVTGTGSSEQDRGRPAVRVRLDPGQEAKLRYVSDVLTGGRQAAARRHRRLPSNIPVNWRDTGALRSSRLRDISAGGAFILTQGQDPPPVGECIEVVLHPGAALPRVRVSSVVSWVHQAGDNAGFGVSFRPADPTVARQLNEVVRHHQTPVAV